VLRAAQGGDSSGAWWVWRSPAVHDRTVEKRACRGAHGFVAGQQGERGRMESAGRHGSVRRTSRHRRAPMVRSIWSGTISFRAHRRFRDQHRDATAGACSPALLVYCRPIARWRRCSGVRRWLALSEASPMSISTQLTSPANSLPRAGSWVSPVAVELRHRAEDAHPPRSSNSQAEAQR
jgi:hypothetical protein